MDVRMFGDTGKKLVGTVCFGFVQGLIDGFNELWSNYSFIDSGRCIFCKNHLKISR